MRGSSLTGGNTKLFAPCQSVLSAAGRVLPGKRAQPLVWRRGYSHADAPYHVANRSRTGCTMPSHLTDGVVQRNALPGSLAS